MQKPYAIQVKDYDPSKHEYQSISSDRSDFVRGPFPSTRQQERYIVVRDIPTERYTLRLSPTGESSISDNKMSFDIVFPKVSISWHLFRNALTDIVLVLNENDDS